ncbi:hypothetical protein ACO0LO_10580 [Undibacterium sp. TJN25]|uniref:hypothetical protein n=1 Tax=Undibacterium sp. TJN25 TaxID=3413056 RepID=UPI003BF04BAB
MAKVDWQRRLQSLIRLYADGAYTNDEVIHAAVILFEGGDLGFNEALWAELPTWVKDGILNVMNDLHEDSILLAPAHSDGDDAVKKRYLELKEWLSLNH